MLDNLSAFLDDTTRPLVVDRRGAAAYIVLVDVRRRRHHRPLRARSRDRGRTDSSRRPACSSSGSCGSASSSWLVYGLLFGAVHPWLFDRAVSADRSHDMTVERTAFAVRSALYVRVRRARRRGQPALRLREGPRRRRGPAQHARRAWRSAPVRPPQLAPPFAPVSVELRALPGVVSRSTRVVAPGAREAAPRSGSGSRSVRCTCSRGCG